MKPFDWANAEPTPPHGQTVFGYVEEAARPEADRLYAIAGDNALILAPNFTFLAGVWVVGGGLYLGVRRRPSLLLRLAARLIDCRWIDRPFS
jgi:hypothetical protein